MRFAAVFMLALALAVDASAALGVLSEGEPKAARTPAVSSAGRTLEPASPSLSAHRAAAVRAIRQVFGSNARAVEVARCESKLNPRAVSPTSDYGLFQLNRPTWDPALNPRARPYWPHGKDWRHVFDPVVNARVAYAISRRGTDFWTHWRWSARCWA